MCGIAGYSRAAGYEVAPSSLTKLLLAGLAERGEDASGYAWRDLAPEGNRGAPRIDVVKHALPPHEFLASVPVSMPTSTRESIVHVRDHTKGIPSHHGNNHPIRHGSICGVHNGIVQNDDALFAKHGRSRALPGMSVDSEAIFMLLDALTTPAEAFGQLVGSYSLAWFDERDGSGVHIARGEGRPLVVGQGDGIAMFASTDDALHFATDRMGIELDIREVPTGTLLRLDAGVVHEVGRFDVQAFTEGSPVRYSRSLPNAQRARELADAHLGEVEAS